MIYPIYVYGTTILRKKTHEISKDYPGLAQLIENMFETMRFSEGVGLAAPQIGLAIRFLLLMRQAQVKRRKVLMRMMMI
jgi:peptide deformylase